MNDHDRNERAETTATASGSWSGTGAGSTRRPVRCAPRPSADSPRPAGAALVPTRARPAHPAGAALAAAELAAQVAERTADLQRVTAEYANYRRRVDRDREAVLVNARVQFVSELLTVLDDVERADAHGDLTGPFKAVADKLIAVVQKLGLESFGLEGEPFDPSRARGRAARTGDRVRAERHRGVRGAAPRLPDRRPGAAAGDGHGRRPRRRRHRREPGRAPPGRGSGPAERP